MFLVSALLVGLPRFLASAEMVSAREQLRSAHPADAGVRAQARLAPDAAEQQQLMDEVIARLGAGTILHVDRTVQSDPVDALLPSGEMIPIILGANFDTDRIRVVEGSWPAATASDPSGALHAEAADSLGLGVGDVVRVGETSITLVATWLAVDPSDPYWFGDNLISTGEASGAHGPLVLPEAQLAALDVNPFVRWTMVPDLEHLDAEGVGALGSAARTWEAAIREEPRIAPGGLVFAGELSRTVAEIERSIASVRGVAPVPLLLAGGAGIVALIQAFRLLSSVRSSHDLLLRARGRSAWAAVALGAAEAAVVAVPAVAAATMLAWAVVRDVSAPTSLATAAGVTLATVLIGGVSAGIGARDASTSRAGSGALATVFALVAIGAGVSLWQFSLYGGPLVASAGGGAIVDPVAVLAPSLSLVACGLAAIAALPLVARLAASILARRRGLGVLPARQVARRSSVYAVPVLVTCLAVGSTTIAGGYATTWADLTSTVGELRNGSDVRVTLPTAANVGGAESIVSSSAVSVTDATAVPVLVAAAEVGDDPATLVALASNELNVANALGDEAARAALERAISAPLQGIALPPEANSVEVRATGVVGPVSLAAWVGDAHGALARVALEGTGDGRFSAMLPRGAAPWTVIAIDTAVAQTAIAGSVNVRILEVGGEADLEPWPVAPEVGGESDVGALAASDGLGFELETTGPSSALLIRLIPGTEKLPFAVSSALADRLGLGIDDSVRFRFAGSGLAVEGTVTAIVPRVPAADGALAAIVDLRSLNSTVLTSSSTVPRPSELWIRTTDVTLAVSELDSQVPTGTRVTTEATGSGAALQRPVVLALWLGAVGTLLLALAATAAVSGSLTRSRRGEIGVLRSLGVTGPSQARSRAGELALVLAWGTVLGLASGVAVGALTVPGLARSAVLDAPTGLPVPLSLGYAPTALAITAFVGAAACVVLFAAVQVARVAAASSGRELDA